MNNQRQLILGVTLCIAAFSGFAAEEPKGQNCALTDPPAEAGESFPMYRGDPVIFGRIYPRLSDIPTDYTGCQVLWATFENQRRTRSLLFLRKGEVAAKYPGPVVPMCKPGERTLDTGCEPRQRALFVSFPAGCLKRTMELRDLPPDCKEEWRKEWRIHDALVE